MAARAGARAAAAVLVGALGACGSSGDDGGEPSDGGGACEIGQSRAALDLPDRAIVGPADLYPADGALRGRDQELRRSHRARREAAWSVVEKVLAPVALAEELPAGATAALPRFQTWYGRDDFQRMFHRMYEGLGPDGRRARAPFGDAAIDDALGWNTAAVHESDSWPLDRYQAYVAAVDSDEEVAGIGGIARVVYSPGAVRHLLASYAHELRCVDGEPPPPFTEGDEPAMRQLVRQPLDLPACERRELGPFFVGSGEELRAEVEGEGAASASVRLLAGPAEARREVCAGAPGEPCAAAGPGPISIEVTAGQAGGPVVVSAALGEARAIDAACLAGPFPLDAAVVKADWRRSDFGMTVPVHDTSAAATAARMAGEQDWGEGVGAADPGPEDIYSVVVPNGQRYRLAGLHVMTKELDHWLWLTLWWSPDPDSDFGADRPAGIAELGGPWRHYKMCAVAWFREEDGDPAGAYRDAAPSLASALGATGAADTAPSWCSNPFIEIGAGNAATNCIGCHQHGGTGLLSEEILDDPTFPDRGRLQVRNNFATDYSWTVDAGEQLGRFVATEVDYYDSFE